MMAPTLVSTRCPVLPGYLHTSRGTQGGMLAGVAQELRGAPGTKRSLVQLLVRAHAQVVT